MTKTQSTSARRFLFLAISIVFLTIFQVHPAKAQLSIQLGGNESELKAALAREGFDRIDTKKLGLSTSTFEACKGDKRYNIKFDWTGRAQTKVIGDCRVQIDQKEIVRQLQRNGYDRISLEDIAGKYLVTACLKGQRERIEINYYGDVRGRKPIGACERELSPEDVTVQLEEKGYNRVNFTQRRGDVYIAQACLNRDLLELKINKFGEIGGSKVIGKCRDGISTDELVSIVEEKGLTQVKIIDGNLPKYRLEACRQNDRVEIVLNRWGDIREETRIGQCRNKYSVEQITSAMRESGYKNISVSSVKDQYITRGCIEGRYNEITLSEYGELVSRKELGGCNSPRLSELAETLRSRGMDDLTFIIEGCEKGRKVRLTIDEFANRTNREEIGRCR